MSSTVIGYTWINMQHSSIGIVVTYNDTMNEYRSYVGQCSGGDKDSDAVMIKQYGAKFPLKQACELIENHGQWIARPGIYDSIIQYDKIFELQVKTTDNGKSKTDQEKN